MGVPEIYEAVKLAEQAAYTLSELNAYEVYWDSVRTERTLIQGRYDEGKAEGLAEGEAKGKTETRIEIAKELKKQGAALSIIEQVTFLSRKELEEL